VLSCRGGTRRPDPTSCSSTRTVDHKAPCGPPVSPPPPWSFRNSLAALRSFFSSLRLFFLASASSDESGPCADEPALDVWSIALQNGQHGQGLTLRFFLSFCLCFFFFFSFVRCLSE
jgi:hypothetical protein